MFVYAQVTIEHTQRHDYCHDTYSQVSIEDEVSYRGLFYSKNTPGEVDGNSSLTEDGSDLKVSFKIRKVLINRPWLDPTILHYQTLGIMGLPPGSWSSGQLNSKTNKGSFPLLPTAMVVAKDIEISVKSFSETVEAKLNETSHGSLKVYS